MPSKSRPDPVIPDHVMLRKIGSGAYGEIWLGRGVTGALRAVKVVWREDFDDERSFEREFEGILKFEPISRDHPGLINILHVGRDNNADGAFYYYVMELGDDIRNGREINPIEYEPRTLRPDVRGSEVVRMELSDCIDVGLRLAEALEHLHGCGLAHRDVKPSNVIFVNGHAKLADIGLVATRDQRTFVGTEGFVPPEGPGSAQADVYSLGKVLYEIATGKDRLDFPELPEDLPIGAERKRWLELNRIICEVCEPRISHRRITTAAELAEALRLLQRGKKRRRGMAGAAWMTSAALLGFATWATWNSARDAGWLAGPPPPLRLPAPVSPPSPVPNTPPVPTIGRLVVVTQPGGADVFDASASYLGTTPVIIDGVIGQDVRVTVRLNGYRTEELAATLGMSAANEPQTIYRELKVFRPPEPGEIWRDHDGGKYLPVGSGHLAFSLVDETAWQRFLNTSKRSPGPAEIAEVSQNGSPSRVVVCRQADAAAYCAWFQTEEIKAGYLTEDHEVRPLMETTAKVSGMSDAAREAALAPFRLKISRIDYASLTLTSEPPGAEVYVNGSRVGTTDDPLLVRKIPPGATGLIVMLEGFRSHIATLELKPGEKCPLLVKLVPSQGVVFDKPWQNGLGMKFVPVGELMVAVWETRVADYAVFLAETGHRPPPLPSFSQTPDHPVVFVSRKDAEAFCEWLTVRERGESEDRLQPNHQYRLPSDLEWSTLTGIRDNPAFSPNWRAMHASSAFPWGIEWPPPDLAGNLADATAVEAGTVPGSRAIDSYRDGFAATAPVGSFRPNPSGLWDIEGNVHEWTSDDYSLLDPYHLGVLRGGCWTTYLREHLYCGARHPQPPEAVADTFGFRVVLARVPPKTGPDTAEPDTESEPYTDTEPYTDPYSEPYAEPATTEPEPDTSAPEPTSAPASAPASAPKPEPLAPSLTPESAP